MSENEFRLRRNQEGVKEFDRKIYLVVEIKQQRVKSLGHI